MIGSPPDVPTLGNFLFYHTCCPELCALSSFPRNSKQRTSSIASWPANDADETNDSSRPQWPTSKPQRFRSSADYHVPEGTNAYSSRSPPFVEKLSWAICLACQRSSSSLPFSTMVYQSAPAWYFKHCNCRNIKCTCCNKQLLIDKTIDWSKQVSL